MITACSKCGRCYEAGSEEQANEPDRLCPTCWLRASKDALEVERSKTREGLRAIEQDDDPQAS
jgi:predicted  nucleic acid-binding Zn-ribbon protein